MEPFVSDTMPDYEHQSDEELSASLHVGGNVEHNDFGRGTILHVTGAGDALKVVVNFQKVGRKHLMLKYAKLKFI